MLYHKHKDQLINFNNPSTALQFFSSEASRDVKYEMNGRFSKSLLKDGKKAQNSLCAFCHLLSILMPFTQP
jgi:hypothetical protein